MATAGRQGSSSKQPAAADQEFDPKYEWQENDKSFILRIHLSGFRKQDFRVQVDGTGRLTVRGQRADAETNAKHSRFSKVFQLPSTSDLDAISGRFEAGVLTLTVPKRPPPPATVADIIKTQPAKQQQVQDQAANAPVGDAKPPPPQDQRKAKEGEEASKPKEDDAKPKDTTSRMPAAEQVADAKRGKPEQEQPKAAAPPAVPVRKEEEGKPKAGDAAAAPVVATDSKQATPTAGEAAAAPVATDRKQATPKPEPPPPPPADAERKAVDPESLAERVKRRAEEDKAAAAAAAAAAAEEAERHRKACRGFKERVAEELQGLAGSEWAEGLVDTVKKNKEVIATAVAAFSLGLFVSSRLFSRSRN